MSSRETADTPRVAGGGIFETDPIERIDAAARRQERHDSFEALRETFGVEGLRVDERVGSVRRTLRKLRRVVIRGKKAAK